MMKPCGIMAWPATVPAGRRGAIIGRLYPLQVQESEIFSQKDCLVSWPSLG